MQKLLVAFTISSMAALVGCGDDTSGDDGDGTAGPTTSTGSNMVTTGNPTTGTPNGGGGSGGEPAGGGGAGGEPVGGGGAGGEPVGGGGAGGGMGGGMNFDDSCTPGGPAPNCGDPYDAAYPCQCDEECLGFGDCCADICPQCDGVGAIACPPAGWTCDPGFFDADDGCDCGCGAHDPDCDDPTQQLYCDGMGPALPGQTCDAMDECTAAPPIDASCTPGGDIPNCGDAYNSAYSCQCDESCFGAGDCCADICPQCDGISMIDCSMPMLPPGWSCSPSYWNAADGCDCSCGGHDPDCDDPTMMLFCDENPAITGQMCVMDVCTAPPGTDVSCTPGGDPPNCGDAFNMGYVCQCDEACFGAGDCCADICPQCDGVAMIDCDMPMLPAGWSCNPMFWNNDDGCDCECGGHDPDCDDPTMTVYCNEMMAPMGTVCDAMDMCVP